MLRQRRRTRPTARGHDRLDGEDPLLTERVEGDAGAWSPSFRHYDVIRLNNLAMRLAVK